MIPNPTADLIDQRRSSSECSSVPSPLSAEPTSVGSTVMRARTPISGTEDRSKTGIGAKTKNLSRLIAPLAAIRVTIRSGVTFRMIDITVDFLYITTAR